MRNGEKILGGGGKMKKDINIPKIDMNEESPQLPPFVEKVTGQIDWIRYYIATTESALRTKINVIWIVVLVLCFIVGFLFAKLLC